eukprot:343935-Rhodomonas_salina.2
MSARSGAMTGRNSAPPLMLVVSVMAQQQQQQEQQEQQEQHDKNKNRRGVLRVRLHKPLHQRNLFPDLRQHKTPGFAPHLHPRSRSTHTYALCAPACGSADERCRCVGQDLGVAEDEVAGELEEQEARVVLVLPVVDARRVVPPSARHTPRQQAANACPYQERQYHILASVRLAIKILNFCPNIAAKIPMMQPIPYQDSALLCHGPSLEADRLVAQHAASVPGMAYRARRQIAESSTWYMASFWPSVIPCSVISSTW